MKIEKERKIGQHLKLHDQNLLMAQAIHFEPPAVVLHISGKKVA